MRLSHTGRTQQDNVGDLRHEAQCRQLPHLPFVDTGLEGEIELAQGFGGGKARHTHPRGPGAGASRFDFGFQQRTEEVGIGALLLGRLFQMALQKSVHFRELEGGEGAMQALEYLAHAAPSNEARASYTESERTSTSGARPLRDR